jgi:hypothetical protein
LQGDRPAEDLRERRRPRPALLFPREPLSAQPPARRRTRVATHREPGRKKRHRRARDAHRADHRRPPVPEDGPRRMASRAARPSPPRAVRTRMRKSRPPLRAVRALVDITKKRRINRQDAGGARRGGNECGEMDM